MSVLMTVRVGASSEQEGSQMGQMGKHHSDEAGSWKAGYQAKHASNLPTKGLQGMADQIRVIESDETGK